MKDPREQTTLPPPELSEKLPCLKGIQKAGIQKDRGRNGALYCPAPPSEPDLQISRIRLSS